MSDQLSPHFSFDELTRTDHSDLQETNRKQAESVRPTLLATAQLLERIRELVGPLQIHSGYRCPELNGAIPGHAVKSQHMLGQAADFSRPGPKMPETVDQLFQAVRAFLHPVRFGQLIREQLGPTCWVHISLGYPWRDQSRCSEVLTMKDGQFTMLEKIG